jgi:membrane protease YdiL (CAAX protease family)
MLMVIAACILIIVSRMIPISSVGFWAFKLGTLYVGIPLLLLFLLKKNPKNYGLTVKNYRESLRYFLVILMIGIPIMVYGSQLQSFKAYYPLFDAETPLSFITNELFIGVVMFSTEFLFRGILMFGLRKKIGWYAILVQTIPYGIVHLGKPPLELYYSFAAGIVLGYIDYKTESILPSFLTHYCSSVIFDLLCL